MSGMNAGPFAGGVGSNPTRDFSTKKMKLSRPFQRPKVTGFSAHSLLILSLRMNGEIMCHIRWMIRGDIAEVLKIEQSSFEFAWTEEDFLRILRQRNCIGMVAEQSEKIVGFMIYEFQATSIHVLNFAVSLEHRRKGIGSKLSEKLTHKLSAHRRPTITLNIRETNLTAQMFFRKMDFIAKSVIRGFYEDTGEDAYAFSYTKQPMEK